MLKFNSAKIFFGSVVFFAGLLSSNRCFANDDGRSSLWNYYRHGGTPPAGEKKTECSSFNNSFPVEWTQRVDGSGKWFWYVGRGPGPAYPDKQYSKPFTAEKKTPPQEVVDAFRVDVLAPNKRAGCWVAKIEAGPKQGVQCVVSEVWFKIKDKEEWVVACRYSEPGVDHRGSGPAAGPAKD